ncbi:MAG TPA: ERAP1-like C-terminal domain-containing protein, partial [Gammaproteobacteria bacterium]|nr:ERAP1-like C-terminal domain-containing protein [Gammaproteobacteria bacterium]
SVWDMVLDTRLRASDFAEFTLTNLGAELDEGIVPQVLETVQADLRYLTLLDSAAAELAVIGPKVESFLWEQVLASPPGSDRQLEMFDYYVEMANTPSVVEELAGLLDGRRTPPAGIQLDQDRRWNLLQALSEVEHPGLDGRIASERGRDASDRGRLRALTVEAARPNLDVKRQWLRRLLGEDAALTLADARAAAVGLFPPSQHGLRAQLSDDILNGLPELNRRRDPSYFSAFVNGFLGSLCDPKYLGKLDAAISQAESLHPMLLRGLRNSRFEVARCIAIGVRQSEKKEPDR